MIGEVLHESLVLHCTQHTFSLHPIRGLDSWLTDGTCGLHHRLPHAAASQRTAENGCFVCSGKKRKL
jgi:hypothetical protein